MQGVHTSQVRTIWRSFCRSGAVRSGGPAMPSPALWGRRRGGFTLTELLIVIAIIGVLASLITAAAVNAMRNSKRARILLEIKNISGALESFNTELNSYPPNGMNDGSVTGLALLTKASSAFERAAKGAFPRINPQELSVFRALAGDLSTPTAVTEAGTLVGSGLSAGEALFFWLGGFSTDAQFPLSGPGGPSYLVADGEVFENRQPRYEFDYGRLGPRTDGELDLSKVRSVTYTINRNGVSETRRINLWRYYADGSEQPYVYFDASRQRPAQYDMPAYDPDVFTDEPLIFPLLQLRTGAAAAGSNARNLTFANHKKFQILHPGLDDVWGDFEPMGIAPMLPATGGAIDDLVLFPAGPFLAEVADTLSNLSDGPLEDSQPE
jgi:prepilin-type N-terminal cleavage/methylation domain-containing protein